jgi:hypothetical protein
VTLTRFVTGANGRYQPVVDRVCLPGAQQIGDFDYSKDGPYSVP